MRRLPKQFGGQARRLTKSIALTFPVANAGPLASALIEAAAQYPEVDLLDLDAVEKAEIAARIAC
jgi:hypothetical protein